MFRKAFSFDGILLLVGAAVFTTPGLGQAQHGGGGHGGGGHGGGAHFGGYHGGANFGGYRGGIYHGGAHNGGYHNGYPYAHHGYRHDHRNYGFYGYYYPDYYDTYPDVWTDPTYDSGYSSSYGDVAPYYGYGIPSAVPPAGNYQAYYPLATVTAPPDTNAHLTVKAPADARVWFEGAPTTSTGPVREFDSPPLTPGSRYKYEVRARWNENGHEVTQTQQVEVTAGKHVEVDFPVQPKTAEKTPVTQKR